MRFRFWILGYGFWVLGLAFTVLGSWFGSGVEDLR
jgi:hypothetical protein